MSDWCDASWCDARMKRLRLRAKKVRAFVMITRGGSEVQRGYLLVREFDPMPNLDSLEAAIVRLEQESPRVISRRNATPRREN
jgi:hypothetical protein